MTLSELQVRLARLIGLSDLADDPTASSWATDALNEAQHKLARELRIPRETQTYASVLTSVSLPPTAQTWGVLAVRDETNDRVLRTVDKVRVLHYRTIYDVGTQPRYVEYDETTGTLTLLPAPASAVDLTVIYAVVPNDLTSSTDEPWNGQYKEWHDIVALRAALLLVEADWGDPSRVGWITRRYNDEYQRLYSLANSVMLSPLGPITRGE